MVKTYTISLIIPCKNEARALETVLEKLPSEVDEIVVVDNNSTDTTKLVAKKYGARVLSETRKDKDGIGYGFALQKGFTNAKGNIIVCMDGDGSYPVEEIKNTINYLIENDLDFISCNRLPFKSPKKMSSVRAFGVKILNTASWLLYGYRIQDSLSGMWVFKRSILNELNLSEGGWNLSLEAKLKAITNKGIKFEEYHIPYQDRLLDLSKQKIFQTGFDHMLFLMTFKANQVFLPLIQKSVVGAKTS